VVQDIFTKLVVATPLPDATAETVARAFISFWIGPYGVPSRLLTDNGSNFTSDLFADLMTVLKIHKLWTTPYHPQTDGSVERFNRTLNSMLSHFVNARQDNWDTFLPLLTLAYNSTFNPTVQNSPFFLWHGREAPSISALLNHIPYMDAAFFGGDAKAAMKSALTAAYKSIIHRQDHTDQETALANLSLAAKPYQLGDRVLILDCTTPTGQKPKYRRRWTGPFVVSAVNGPLSYTVQSSDGQKVYRAHAEHLKAVYVNTALDSTAAMDTQWPAQAAPATAPKNQLLPVAPSVISLQTDSPTVVPEVSSGTSSSGLIAPKSPVPVDEDATRPSRVHRLPLRFRGASD